MEWLQWGLVRSRSVRGRKWHLCKDLKEVREGAIQAPGGRVFQREEPVQRPWGRSASEEQLGGLCEQRGGLEGESWGVRLARWWARVTRGLVGSCLLWVRWAAWEGFEQRRDRILVLVGSLRLRTENGQWGDEGGGGGTVRWREWSWTRAVVGEMGAFNDSRLVTSFARFLLDSSLLYRFARVLSLHSGYLGYLCGILLWPWGYETSSSSAGVLALSPTCQGDTGSHRSLYCGPRCPSSPNRSAHPASCLVGWAPTPCPQMLQHLRPHQLFPVCCTTIAWGHLTPSGWDTCSYPLLSKPSWFLILLGTLPDHFSWECCPSPAFCHTLHSG